MVSYDTQGVALSVQFLTQQGPTLLAIPTEGDSGGGGRYMWDPLVNPHHVHLCWPHSGLSVVLRFLCVSQVYLNAAASLIMVRNM